MSNVQVVCYNAEVEKECLMAVYTSRDDYFRNIIPAEGKWVVVSELPGYHDIVEDVYLIIYKLCAVEFSNVPFENIRWFIRTIAEGEKDKHELHEVILTFDRVNKNVLNVCNYLKCDNVLNIQLSEKFLK